MAFIAPVTASSPTATPTGVDGLAANSTIVSNGVDGSTTTPNPDTTGADAVGLVQEQLEAGKERTCFASTDYAEG
jgi:hypothetical protein